MNIHKNTETQTEKFFDKSTFWEKREHLLLLICVNVLSNRVHIIIPYFNRWNLIYFVDVLFQNIKNISGMILT